MGGGEGAFPAGEEATRGEDELTAQAQHFVPHALRSHTSKAIIGEDVLTAQVQHSVPNNLRSHKSKAIRSDD